LSELEDKKFLAKKEEKNTNKQSDDSEAESQEAKSPIEYLHSPSTPQGRLLPLLLLPPPTLHSHCVDKITIALLNRSNKNTQGICLRSNQHSSLQAREAADTDFNPHSKSY